MPVRSAHSDMEVPDFSFYRRKSTADPTSNNADSAASRQAFSYMYTAGLGVGGFYTGTSLVNAFVSTLAPDAATAYMAKTEIKLADIPEGKSMSFKWRGKPLFVRHRSVDEMCSGEADCVSRSYGLTLSWLLLLKVDLYLAYNDLLSLFR